MTGLRDALLNDVETLKAMLLAERARAERLAQIIKELQRHRFGRQAETLPLDQLELGLEDVQQVEAADAAETERPILRPARSEKATQRRANRVSLSALPPRGGGDRHQASARDPENHIQDNDLGLFGRRFLA